MKTTYNMPELNPEEYKPRPNESPQQYNERIAAARGDTPEYLQGIQAATQAKTGAGFTMSGEQLGATRTPGESIEDFTKRLGGGTVGVGTGTATVPPPKSPAAPVVGTSTAERMKAKALELKEAFGLGDAPQMPGLFGEMEKSSLNLARQERDLVNKEMETILNERLTLEEQFRQFKSKAGEGVSEGGRIGALSEEGRKVGDQLDSLNRRELVLETKLRNRNAIVSEMMGLQKDDYANTVTQYNTRFSQALQLYGLFDKEQDEVKTNAKANLDVFSGSIQAQIEAGKLKPDQITSTQRMKIEDLETQAGLPLGSTLAILQTLKPGEEKLYSGVDDYGNFVYISKDANGQIVVKKAPGAVPQIPPKSSGGNGTSPQPGKNQTDVNKILSSIGLPLTAADKSAGLTQSSLNKVVKAGVSLEIAQGIWQNIIAGNTLEEIRVGLAGQFGREVGYGYLDKFMTALQGKTNSDIEP